VNLALEIAYRAAAASKTLVESRKASSTTELDEIIGKTRIILSKVPPLETESEFMAAMGGQPKGCSANVLAERQTSLEKAVQKIKKGMTADESIPSVNTADGYIREIRTYITTFALMCIMSSDEAKSGKLQKSTKSDLAQLTTTINEDSLPCPVPLYESAMRLLQPKKRSLPPANAGAPISKEAKVETAM
jgi:hypothetical protein